MSGKSGNEEVHNDLREHEQAQDPGDDLWRLRRPETHG